MKLKHLNQCFFVCLVIIWMDTANAELLVSVQDQNQTPVENAVIVAYPAGMSVPSLLPSQQITMIMDQRDKQFIPYVLPVRTGTPVNFPNSDNIRHQVYSFSPAKVFKLPLYHDTPAEAVIFDNPGVVVLGCNIHDQMIAYIYVTDSEYFAKTESGQAAIADLPSGMYEVILWHPSMASPDVLKQSVEIKAENTTLNFNLELKYSVENPQTLTPLEQRFKDLLRETN